MTDARERRDARLRVSLSAWLRTFTGCGFASSFAQATGDLRRLIIAAVDPWQDVGADLDTALAALGKEEKAALIVFPSIDREQDLLPLFDRLAKTGRWKWKLLREDGETLPVQITWRTDWGCESMVMGFAPFLSMPETRRAPYVCLALWPGQRTKTKEEGIVSFKDMPSRLAPEQHKKLIESTLEGVDDILGEERSKEYVAFILPRRVCGKA